MMPQGRQAPQHPGFVGGDQPYDCGACIASHGERYGFPTIDGLEAQAWGLYAMIQDQQRVGMDVIGLDYAVLPAVFDLYGVPPAPSRERRRLFERIVWVNRAVAEHRAIKAKQEQERAKLARH